MLYGVVKNNQDLIYFIYQQKKYMYYMNKTKFHNKFVL
jgi:hypothetical protein